MITRRAFTVALAAISQAASVPQAAAVNESPIVITGDLGRVGTALHQIWSDRQIVGIDIKRGPEEDLLANSDWNSKIKDGSIVVHLAIREGWDADTAEYDHRLNTAILVACIEKKAARLVFTSSQMARPRDLDIPFTYYGAEKIGMEARMEAASEQDLLQARCLRLGTFLPGQREIAHDWTRVNNITLEYWINKAIDLKDAAPFRRWDVIGQTVR